MQQLLGSATSSQGRVCNMAMQSTQIDREPHIPGFYLRIYQVAAVGNAHQRVNAGRYKHPIAKRITAGYKGGYTLWLEREREREEAR